MDNVKNIFSLLPILLIISALLIIFIGLIKNDMRIIKTSFLMFLAASFLGVLSYLTFDNHVLRLASNVELSMMFLSMTTLLVLISSGGLCFIYWRNLVPHIFVKATMFCGLICGLINFACVLQARPAVEENRALRFVESEEYVRMNSRKSNSTPASNPKKD